MTSHLHVSEAAIVSDRFDDEFAASAHVELHFEPGNERAALKLLARAAADVIVAARRLDGTHG